MPRLRVFISWSGKRSKAIGDALYNWLPTVIQGVDPWMSNHDIEKGARGEMEIAKTLEGSQVGVICLTPTNLHADWILFEAGALSKMQEAHVCTYLWKLKPSDVEKPLGAFQHTLATKDETRHLIETINGRLEEPLKDSVLASVFEKMWPDLENRLTEAGEIAEESEAEERRSTESMLAEVVDTLRKVEKRVSTVGSVPFPWEEVRLSDAESRLLQALLSAPNGLPLSVYKGERFDKARASIVEKGYVDRIENRFVLNENGLRALGGLLIKAWERVA